jgi:hypothetical protein
LKRSVSGNFENKKRRFDYLPFDCGVLSAISWICFRMVVVKQKRNLVTTV